MGSNPTPSFGSRRLVRLEPRDEVEASQRPLVHELPVERPVRNVHERRETGMRLFAQGDLVLQRKRIGYSVVVVRKLVLVARQFKEEPMADDSFHWLIPVGARFGIDPIMKEVDLDRTSVEQAGREVPTSYFSCRERKRNGTRSRTTRVNASYGCNRSRAA